MVVSDTSVITALLQIGQIELLPRLYTKVVLPEAVHEELGRAHSDLPSPPRWIFDFNRSFRAASCIIEFRKSSHDQ